MNPSSQSQTISILAQAPRVFDYLDYRLFLRELYQFNKKNVSGFSYTKWAELGAFKSRSYLRLVMLSKRNLSEDSLLQVTRALSLNKKEIKYFTTLVHYNQSTQFQSREYYFNELMKQKNSETGNVVKETYQFLSSHIAPRVHLLIGMPSIDRSLTSLAQLVGSSESKVLPILEQLKEIGLAEEKDGVWFSQQKEVTVPDDFGNLAIQSFHRKSLEEAAEAIQLPKSTRSFFSLIAKLSAEEFKEVRTEIDQFVSILQTKYGNKIENGQRLYQLNFNIIPASKELIHTTHESEPKTLQESIKEDIL